MTRGEECGDYGLEECRQPGTRVWCIRLTTFLNACSLIV